jgi:hypothetical protein
MRRLFSVAASWLLLTAVVCGAELDRLVAAVNGKVLTQLDLELARRLNVVLSAGGQDPGSKKPGEEIERMIDFELVRQELQNFPADSADESRIEQQTQELRRSYESEPGGLQAVARRYGVTDADVNAYLRVQASIMRFVNFRFSPFATVTDSEVTRYYEDNLVPRLRAANARIPAVGEISEKIREVLRAEKVNAALEQWIQDLRRHARIEYFQGADVPLFSKPAQDRL